MATRPRAQRRPAVPRASKHLVSVFSVAQDVELRREDLDGKEHVVLPMIALIEGSYQCANCPTPNFYPAAEFGKNVGAWNGRPVTIGHPQRSGTFISAGTPDVWETERIGTVFNAQLDGKKLRVEAWLDPDAVERAGDEAQAVLEAAEAGEQVEVSTAAWIDELPRVGVHKGRQYEGVQVNFQPDHIAILNLGDIGACSWEDGCGVRVAQAPGCNACACGGDCPCRKGDAEFAAQQTARSKERALDVAVEQAYDRWAMVADYDDEFVFFVVEGREGMRRRRYTEDEEGNVALADEEDERVRVRQDFVVVNVESKSGAAEVTTVNSGKETTISINTEEDGDMAGTSKAAAQEPSEPKTTGDAPKAAGDPKPHDNSAMTDHGVLQRIAALEASNEKLVAENQELKAQVTKPATLEEWLEAAPSADMRHFLQASLKDQEKRRLDLVGTVLKAPGCMHTEDELKAMQVGDLEKLVALAARPDFSVQAREQSALAICEDDGFAPVPTAPWDRSAQA